MKFLKTILVGCAWCKKVIDVVSHKTEGDDYLIVISHGMCDQCSANVCAEYGLDEDEKESEDA